MAKKQRSKEEKKKRRRAFIWIGAGTGLIALLVANARQEGVGEGFGFTGDEFINSDYYYIGDFTVSDTALAKDIQEQWNPPNADINRGAVFANNILDPITKKVGHKLYINSWWRSAALDAELGVSHKSQHAVGEAIDINPRYEGVNETRKIIQALMANSHPWDQLILENGTPTNPVHIHISSRPDNNRREVLTYDGSNYYAKTLQWLDATFG